MSSLNGIQDLEYSSSYNREPCLQIGRADLAFEAHIVIVERNDVRAHYLFGRATLKPIESSYFALEHVPHHRNISAGPAQIRHLRRQPRYEYRLDNEGVVEVRDIAPFGDEIFLAQTISLLSDRATFVCEDDPMPGDQFRASFPPMPERHAPEGPRKTVRAGDLDAHPWLRDLMREPRSHRSAPAYRTTRGGDADRHPPAAGRISVEDFEEDEIPCTLR